MIKFLFSTLVTASAQINIIDSVDDSRLTYINIDQCVVLVPKVKLTDWCFISKEVKKTCKLDIKLEECDEKR